MRNIVFIGIILLAFCGWYSCEMVDVVGELATSPKDSVALRLAPTTIWEVYDQDDFNNLWGNMSQGDEVIIKTGTIYLKPNASGHCHFNQVNISADHTTKPDFVFTDSCHVLALKECGITGINFTKHTDIDFSDSPYVTLWGIGSDAYLDDVELAHDNNDSASIMIRIDHYKTGAGEAWLNDVYGIGVARRPPSAPDYSGLLVFSSKTVTIKGNTRFLYAEEGDNCNPAERKIWGTMILEDWDIGPTTGSPDEFDLTVDPNISSMVVDSYDKQCDATVSFSITFNEDNEDISNVYVEYGCASYSDTATASYTSGKWRAKLDTSGCLSPSCQFQWRPFVVRCENTDHEDIYVGSGQLEEIVCGICQGKK